DDSVRLDVSWSGSESESSVSTSVFLLPLLRELLTTCLREFFCNSAYSHLGELHHYLQVSNAKEYCYLWCLLYRE
ncbi:hypothetical protein C0J52_12199, partial [Blattella germanica]